MSTAPAVKAAILTILTADSDLNTVDKRWAPPTEAEDYAQEPEAIYFGDTEIVDDNWASLGKSAGTGRRRETYRVTITVLVAQTGDNPQAAEERAWNLWGQVADDLRTDLFAGTPAGSTSLLVAAGARQFDQITATQTTGVWGPQQWAARIDGRVTLTASL